ncbi:nucleoside deaminase [Paenibacillus sp. GSMTC-2017]|uniref:nucleoside deaminase n=1 Tax=Paenibacillus sp. GSMTC-2017 TaxID=2794350 RepID=UPI0018D7017A|nr:nucleoside deaminase [Paenibacillus sp. GSMTC-2017]MBH5319583.1 nucleoside deaminase [Paenibacillus sp. GSMTC-2017]
MNGRKQANIRRIVTQSYISVQLMKEVGLNMQSDRYYLELAFEEAEKASCEGSIPIGAVLVAPNGDVISRGRNQVFTAWDPTCHAEIDAIRGAGKLLFQPEYKNKCTLYSTVEPCPMCTGALILADINRAVWALSDNYLGALRIAKEGNHFRHKYDKINITVQPYVDLAEKSESLHKEFDTKRGVTYAVSNVSIDKSFN